MKKLFAIVGESNWGKSNTLYELFNRRQFRPMQRPITVKDIPYRFIVINASNEDRPSEDYLERLEKILNHHKDEEIIYIITVSLVFKTNNHYVKPVLDYLNALREAFDIHYIVLNNGWKNGTLNGDPIDKFRAMVNNNSDIHEFAQEINMSKTTFNGRTKEILATILSFI